jgi:subtilisin family serine protease
MLKLLLRLMLGLMLTPLIAAQTTSTRCQTEDVTVLTNVIERRLVGCGDGFPANLLWHLDRADSRNGALDDVMTRTATGKGAVVYVMDTGILQTHDEFMRADGSIVIGALHPDGVGTFCPVGRNPALDPCFSSASLLYLMGHGTGVASVIAGRTTGVAPDARLVSVLAMQAGTDVASWLRHLDAVVQHAWDPATPQFQTAIINMSFAVNLAKPNDPAFPQFEAKMRRMIEGVDRDGNADPAGKKFLFVVLAGNYLPERGSHCAAGKATNIYPSILGNSIDGLITVGGIGRDNQLWDRSCAGSAVDLLAPADDMLVASPSGHDHYRSAVLVSGFPMNAGTSYATPYVSGLAALLLENHPSLTPARLEVVLKSTASRVSNLAEATAGGLVAGFPAPMVRRRAARP